MKTTKAFHAFHTFALVSTLALILLHPTPTLCQSPPSPIYRTVQFTSPTYTILYMRIVKPPLPDYLIHGWQDPNAWLVMARVNLPAGSCHAYEITTRLTNPTTNPPSPTTPTSTEEKQFISSQTHSGWLSALLVTNLQPISATIRCLVESTASAKEDLREGQ